MNIKSKLPLFFLVGAIMLTQCEDETVHRDYPRITTNSVTNISASGATFVGEILEMGDAPVTEHGFIWSTVSNLNVSTDNKVLLGAFNKTGEFKADITTTLVSNYKYYVCAFVQSGEYLVYGTTVTFESLGSKAPTITDFSPKDAGWADTINITGKNFSWVPNYNRVFVGSHLVPNILSVTDTTLRFLLPPTVSEHKNAISIDIVGNVATLKGDSLTFIEPEFHDYFPKSANWGDTISFYGRYLKCFGEQVGNGIFFGSQSAASSFTYEDTVVKILVPYLLLTESSAVSIKLNGYKFSSDTAFTLLPPVIDSILPKTGTWGSTVTLYGKFNTTGAQSKVFLNGVQMTFTSLAANAIKFKIPSDLKTESSTITYKSGPFTVESPENFVLVPPEIKYFTPASGCSGTLVKIGGKNFKSGYTKVSFGTANATFQSINDSVIYCYVPSVANGNCKVNLTAGNTTISSANNFNVTNHTITTVSPTSVSYGDVVTVTGENFKTGMTWRLGTNSISPISLTSTEAKFTVPYTLLYTPLQVSAAFTLNSVSHTATSSDLLTLKDFTVSSITPMIGKPGDVLVLTGENLNPYNLKVEFGSVNATLTNATTTGVNVTIPALYNGNYEIKISVAGKSITYSELFVVNGAPWTRLTDIPFLYNNACTFDFGEEVYVAVKETSATVRSIYHFNSATYGFEKLAGTYTSEIVNPFSCTLNGTGYIIGPKSTLTMGLEMFDPQLMTWTKLPDYPGKYTTSPIFFADDSVIYAGCGIYVSGSTTYGYRNFYKYSPKTNKWTQLKDCPDTPVASNHIFIDGRLLVADSRLYEYFPATNTWSYIESYVGNSGYDGKVSVALDGYWYLGLGYYSQDYNSNIFYRLFPATNVWSTLRPSPIYAHKNPMSFTIGSYIFVGGGQNQSYTDFYMYDPSKE